MNWIIQAIFIFTYDTQIKITVSLTISDNVKWEARGNLLSYQFYRWHLYAEYAFCLFSKWLVFRNEMQFLVTSLLPITSYASRNAKRMGHQLVQAKFMHWNKRILITIQSHEQSSTRVYGRKIQNSHYATAKTNFDFHHLSPLLRPLPCLIYIQSTFNWHDGIVNKQTNEQSNDYIVNK